MGFSDIVHGVLDVAGFIPVVGVVADVANAAVYAAEGDWGNAALSAVSAIPVVGDAAAVAGKSIKVISKVAKASEKALSKAKKMKSFFGMMKGKAKTGAKKLFNKINRKLKARKQKRAAKHVCTNGKCFTGDMLIYTKQGLRPIKEIQKGDDIYSRNMQTGEIDIRKVEEVFQTEAHTIHHIWLDGKEELKTTAYHPIFVKDQGWVSAINLREGNLVQTFEGTAQVTKIEKTRHEEPVEVFNFHVEEWESYFVSEKRAYVHNGGGHGGSGDINYKKVFFDKHPELKGEVVVHHSIEQQVIDRYPGLFTKEEINDYKMLRGIPKELNNDIHLSKIRREWNSFYKKVDAGEILLTKNNFLNKAKEIDNLFGSKFKPPI